MAVAASFIHRAHKEADSYRAGSNRPLVPFLAIMAAYGGLTASGAALLRRNGVRLPERISWHDTLLAAIATHRITRTIAKDPVTAPLRAPFTEYRGPAGEAELHEEVREDSAVRHAVGELVTCPFCLAQWTATAVAFGLITAPRPTRIALSVFTITAGADALQFAYSALRRTS
jgi:hypothetical protein